jgi:hypothetical protein
VLHAQGREAAAGEFLIDRVDLLRSAFQCKVSHGGLLPVI